MAAETPAKKPAKKAATKNTSANSKAIKKIWLDSYPPGVNAEIGELQYASVAALIEDACRNYSSLPAFYLYGKDNHLQRHRPDFIDNRWMASVKRTRKGDRVAIMMPNILQYSVVLPAILRAGYTVVNVNPLYTPRELEHQLNDSGAKAIFVLENFATTVQEVRSKVGVEHVVVTSMGDMLGGLKECLSILLSAK